ncbi:ERV/ALR sulfhydryl oxidase domain-containing protein [Pilobolus umbonatus]|nr:ERV/ALR sulfhydryl oxidase domain-containing protein [Pilobolus umbonatus]
MEVHSFNVRMAFHLINEPKDYFFLSSFFPYHTHTHMRPLSISAIILLLIITGSLYCVYTPWKEKKSSDDTVIMSYMGNATQKAELGRASWKLLHTIMSKYPETPTHEERTTLNDFMHLFTRLYPCGECASHFNTLLASYPPQTSSRAAASLWLCSIHNKVNERLQKPIYDCMNIESQYPCGCSAEVDAPIST